MARIGYHKIHKDVEGTSYSMLSLTYQVYTQVDGRYIIGSAAARRDKAESTVS